MAKYQKDPKITEFLEPHHNEEVEKKWKEREKDRERERERVLKKEAEKISAYQKQQEIEAEKRRAVEQQERRRKGRGGGGGGLIIGAPTNLTHLVHVDLDFRWSGDNPAVEFEFLSRFVSI